MATQPPLPQATTADAPLLVQHADRAPPLGALLAAEVAGITVETKVDPKLGKGAEPVLVLPGGRYVFSRTSMDRKKDQAVGSLDLDTSSLSVLTFDLLNLISPKQKRQTTNNNDNEKQRQARRARRHLQVHRQDRP